MAAAAQAPTPPPANAPPRLTRTAVVPCWQSFEFRPSTASAYNKLPPRSQPCAAPNVFSVKPPRRRRAPNWTSSTARCSCARARSSVPATTRAAPASPRRRAPSPGCRCTRRCLLALSNPSLFRSHPLSPLLPLPRVPRAPVVTRSSTHLMRLCTPGRGVTQRRSVFFMRLRRPERCSGAATCTSYGCSLSEVTTVPPTRVALSMYQVT